MNKALAKQYLTSVLPKYICSTLYTNYILQIIYYNLSSSLTIAKNPPVPTEMDDLK